MHALSSRVSGAQAPLVRSGTRTRPSVVRAPISRGPAAPRSASREEALRALESFSAGVAARVAVVASASPSDLAATTATTTTTATPAALTSADGGPGLRSLTAETFWPFIREEAGDKLVVVDFYTQWCGPCKLIYPKLVELSLEWEPRGVAFCKCDCNAEFKAVGKELGIRVAPTFHLYRNGQKVAEMTGAHVERLQALVEEHLAGGAEGEAAAAPV